MPKFKPIPGGLRQMDPRVFRLAAEMMAAQRSGWCASCCWDIRVTCHTLKMDGSQRIEHMMWFRELFQPETPDDGGWWWFRCAREPRLLALQLAELIAKENRRELKAGRIPRHL